MTAGVYSEDVEVYYAWCEECGWDGSNRLNEEDAQYEMDKHNETCNNGDEPDTRTELEKFQSDMDTLIHSLKDSGVIA